MFRKTIFTAILPLVFLGFSMPAGDCDQLIFFREGTTTTQTSYDAANKLTGTTKVTYKKVTKSADGIQVEAISENLDKKGKSEGSSQLVLRCVGGTLHFDMKAVLTGQQAEAYKDFEISVEGTDKEIPPTMEVGKDLRESNMKFSFRTKDGMDMSMMNMTVRVFNRKIEAFEKITTPAGSWDCYKISEDVEMKSIVKVRAHSVSWFSYQAGIVKSESYDEKGKLTGRTELTAISQ